MKTFEIRIGYSWGDEEEPVVVESESVEEAFDKMIDMAYRELKVSLQENREAHSIVVDPDNNKITLWYGYDSEECYYELVEREGK